jgi:heat shock protein HslJ
MAAIPIRAQAVLTAALAASLATAIGTPLAVGQSPLTVAEAGAPLARQPDGQLPLEGTPWRLSRYRWKGVERVPGPEVAARMTLSGGTLKASGGCTTFGGAYGTTGSAITFDLRGVRKSDCGEQATIVQTALVEGLRKAAGYRLVAGEQGDELVLRSAVGNELLRFRLDEVGALDTHDWILEAYQVDGRRSLADPTQPARLSFRTSTTDAARRRSRGRLNASSGCNGIVGDYARSADVLSFGPLERTDAPCLPGPARQEEAMIGMLDATSMTIALAGDRLALTSDDTGDRLELASARPLEGTTWQLVRVPGSERTAGPVVMRLKDERMRGEGPCGPIEAAYVSDGLFITFDDVRGSGDEACADLAAEKKLLAALRSTVVLDRERPQLRLRDAGGRVVARFRSASAP